MISAPIPQRLGKRKVRIVVDSKRSRVSKACRRIERCILPRIIDVVADILDLLVLCLTSWPGHALSTLVEFVVADFADAFFQIPLHRAEWRYFAVQFRGRVYIFRKTTQGSRGAPLTWSRTAALLARLTQGVINNVAKLNVYVDDPFIAFAAPQPLRAQMQALTLILWSTLQFPLSLAKGKKGLHLDWTSASFKLLTAPEWGVEARIKQSLVDDASSMTIELAALNVIPIKTLESYTGKMNHISSLIVVLRPFIRDLYAAIHSRSTVATRAPRNCIWKHQVFHVLCWAHAFFRELYGPLRRVFWLSAHTNRHCRFDLNLDASPWGLGAVLSQNGRLCSWFAVGLSAEELTTLAIEKGSPRAQQAVEALCALVALRTWASWWSEQRVLLRVKSDSISALVLAVKLKTTGAACNIIAREMALDLAAASHLPVVAEHVPGLANVVPDLLSRRHQPGVSFVVPTCLQLVPEVHPPSRTRAYFKSLAIPPSPLAHPPAPLG